MKWSVRSYRALVGALAVVLAAGAAVVWAQSPQKMICANYGQSLEMYELPQGESGSSALLLDGERSSVYLWQLRTQMQAHHHRAHEETVVVMQGEGECRVAGAYRRITKGDIIVALAGRQHSVRNTGSELLAGISIFTPRYDGKDRVVAGAGGKGK